MALRDFLKKIKVDPAHWPTVMLVIGYPLFWIEMWAGSGKDGIVSSAAWGFWFLFLLTQCVTFLLCCKDSPLKFSLSKPQGLSSWLTWVVVGLAVLVLGRICYASSFPPYLMQEYDVLNYHYALPRQHLVTGSFAHIAWSTADLFMMPIQFALAPFWFVQELPNKWPQLFFALGLLGVLSSLLRQANVKRRFWLVVVVLATHGIVIQMGTAMLDLVIAYLLFAFIDSCRRKQWGLALVELGFYFWSKPFIPFQTGFIGVLFIGVLAAAHWCKFDYSLSPWFSLEDWRKEWKDWPWRKALIYFSALSVLIALPFMIKSWWYAGTPMYPFFTDTLLHWSPLKEEAGVWISFLDATHDHMGARNAYGAGRSLWQMLQHWWWLAVPEVGVNNRFDYPLGLPLLLFIGPFVWFFGKDVLKKKLDIFGLLIILFWCSWWIGSQQARFLYIPLLAMYLFVFSRKIQLSLVLKASLLCALILSNISVWRAHASAWGKAPIDVLRKEDRQMVAFSDFYIDNGSKGFVYSVNHEAAYARYPLIAVKPQFPFVIKVKGWKE